MRFLTCLPTHSRRHLPTTNSCARDGGGPVKTHRSVAFVLSVVSVLTFTQLLPANAQAAALQSAYSFDVASGSTVPDVSGNGNSLSMLNGAILGTGKYGLAMSFDGVNDVLVANGYNPALNLTSAGFTLSAWINPRSNGGWQMIVNKPYTTGHSAPYFDWSMHRQISTGRIVLFLGCEGVQRVSNATTPINAWTHVAVTYDGSAIRHYINGNLDRTTSASCKVTNTNSRPIRIGSNGANSETMNGLIDDVRIYDRMLSGTEIQTDMATPLGGAPPTDTTPPTVVIATPTYDAIVSGTVTITANAADNVGVAGVQFQVDGQNVTAEDVSAPYSIGWNTTLVPDGSHTLVAVARDAAGNGGSSTPTIVHVRNLSSAPTVLLSATPTSVASGASAELTWSSTNATGCTASGAWSGIRATSGSASTGPLTAASNMFTLTCTGIGGSASATTAVPVNTPIPAPTVTLSASPTSVASGASSNLTWSSLNATSCTASGAWSGNRATAGSASTGPLTAASNTFALTCSGTGGSTSASAIVTVTAATPAPTLALTANPSVLTSGASATLTWSSANATSCTASGAWSGSRALLGSTSTGPLTAAINTFTLTCTGIGGSASATTVVTASPPEPATRLQSAYSFDVASGSTVPDVSGNGNSLSMLNGAILGTGKYGLAMSFDGVNDVLVANGYSPALNLTSAGFTLSAWINPRSNGGWQMIVNKPYTTGHSAPYFDWSMHRQISTGRIVLFLGCEGVQRVSNATTPINAWTHVAVTYDGSAIRHYINGNLDRTTSASCKVTNTNSRPIRIGSNGANSETMNGLIDDVRIYDRVLSGTEIQTDMATPLGGAPPTDTTPPTVVIATPTYDAIVSGTVTITANAADNVGVAGVQFQVDGQNVTAEDVSAPYSIGWNTTLVPDGSHTLVAVARDAAGNGGSSTPTIVHVRNLSSAPTVLLSATPTSVASGASAELTWSSTNATGCTASGAWSGIRATSGSASTGPLTAASNMFTLTCTGVGGLASVYAIVTVSASIPAPTVTLSASPTSVASGASSNLTWSSLNATSCTASGAWSGNRATAGSASTAPLTAASNTFALTCSGTGGSTSASAIVTVTGAAAQRGLDFEGSASTSGTVRFKFTNPLAIYPATYIWKVYPVQQSGYYTTFFWGNDDGAGTYETFAWDNGVANTFYGAHPYPNWPDVTTHRWEIATDHGGDFVSTELVVYDRWYTQALVAWSDSAGKHTVFYWDLPDTSKRIEHVADPSYGNTNPPAPALTWGDAPWNPSNEIMNGVIRGIQIYSTALSVNDVLAELSAPQSTSAGASNIWYMNLDPTPSDISDKSGRGHHPMWVGAERPLIWTGQ